MSEHGVIRLDASGPHKLEKPVLRPVPGDGCEEARVLDLGWSKQIEAARKREDRWTEIDLVLEMWDRVAHSWNNETLMRLARYARMEAETERELERRSR